MKQKEEKTYRGIIWVANTELSIKLGMSRSYISNAIRRGKSVYEAIDDVLDGKVKRKKKEESYRGITWTSYTDLSKQLGMSKGYIYEAIQRGKSIYEAIDDVLDGKVKPKNKEEKTYRGITWVANTELCIKLGMSHSYISGAIRRGKSIYEAIDDVLDGKVKRKKKEEIYRSITWTDYKDLSIQLGMSLTYIYGAIQRGKSVYEAIDDVLDGKVKPRKKEETYRGIIWSDNGELSRKLGMNRNYISKAIRRGKSIYEAIDDVLDGKTKPGKKRNKEEETYRGISWTSYRNLSIKLGKDPTYISGAIQRGKSVYEAIDDVLDGKVKPKKKEETYRGITWSGNGELSKQLGISDGYIYYNIRNGKSIYEVIDNALMKKALSIGKFDELSIINYINYYSIYYSVIFNCKEDVWSSSEILDYIGDVSILLDSTRKVS